MEYDYVEVTVKIDDKVHGKVRFNVGEGDKEHYIKRAQIFANPYVMEHNSNISYKTSIIHTDKPCLIEFYIPSID